MVDRRAMLIFYPDGSQDVRDMMIVTRGEPAANQRDRVFNTLGQFSSAFLVRQYHWKRPPMGSLWEDVVEEAEEDDREPVLLVARKNTPGFFQVTRPRFWLETWD
jgi:hypothetical protein